MPEEPKEPTGAAAPATPEFEVVDLPQGLSDDWDDVFAWSYGPRFWNIGCG